MLTHPIPFQTHPHPTISPDPEEWTRLKRDRIEYAVISYRLLDPLSSCPILHLPRTILILSSLRLFVSKGFDTS